MKNKISCICLLIAAAAAPLALQAADTKTSSARGTATEYVKDSVITAKVKAEFAKDRGVSALRINVDTDRNGVVRLSGTAKSQVEIDKAVSIAKAVSGVTSVNSEIRLQPNS